MSQRGDDAQAGGVSLGELRAQTRQQLARDGTTAEATFRQLDADGSGALEERELAGYLKR